VDPTIVTSGNYGSPTTFTINEGTTIDNTSGGPITTRRYHSVWNGSFTFVGSSDLLFSSGGGGITIPNDITVTTATLDKTLKCGSGIYQTMARLTKKGPGTLQIDANGSQALMGGLNVYEGVYATSLAFSYWNSLCAGPIFLGDPEAGNSRNAVIDCIKVSQQGSSITVNAGSSGTLALLFSGSTSLQSILKLNNNLTLATLAGQTLSQLGLITGTGNLNIGVPSGGLSSITVYGVSKSLNNVNIVRLMNANTFTGNTVVNSGTLSLYNSLALQNSVLDTATSVANKITLLNGLTALTLGGLSGDKNMGIASGDMFATSSSYFGNITNLTLNPSVGQTPSYSGIIKDGAAGMSLTKTGEGTQTLAGANTYTGAMRIEAGTLKLGANDVLPNTAITMSGGTLDADTYSDTLGALTVTGDASISFGAGGALIFPDSSGMTWTGTLNITGAFVDGVSIRFGTSAGGLTTEQQERITVDGTPVALNGAGYLMAVRGTVIIFE
jgi:autotransporter-associated beta strand protein